MTAERFPAWPKIPRWNKDFVITEKIDGTNGLISIEPIDPMTRPATNWEAFQTGDVLSGTASIFVRDNDGTLYAVRAGSRKRWIGPTKETDNMGFGRWVQENAGQLIQLGEGLHYGEWWGSGIQRGYGLQKGEKRFSLFNTGRWNEENVALMQVPGLHVVPILSITTGTHINDAIALALDNLRYRGSLASTGFGNPEGIIVYSTQAKQYWKVLLEGDDIPKSLQQAAEYEEPPAVVEISDRFDSAFLQGVADAA